MENEKCYYYKKYEKEIDFYNGDIIPNFLEISIKWNILLLSIIIWVL